MLLSAALTCKDVQLLLFNRVGRRCKFEPTIQRRWCYLGPDQTNNPPTPIWSGFACKLLITFLLAVKLLTCLQSSSFRGPHRSIGDCAMAPISKEATIGMAVTAGVALPIIAYGCAVDATSTRNTDPRHYHQHTAFPQREVIKHSIFNFLS
jgi:hypothetical protein